MHRSQRPVSYTHLKIADAARVSVVCGSKIEKSELEKITALMAELLVCTLGGREIYDNMSGSRTTIYEQPQKTLLEAVRCV